MAGALRVLVADDNALLREGIASLLEDAHIAGAIQRHPKEQLTRPSRKQHDPRSEQSLEPSSERQRRRQRSRGCDRS